MWNMHPYHLYLHLFWISLSHSSLLWDLVLALKGTMYHWSPSTSFLLVVTQQISLCSFLLQPLCFQAEHTKSTQLSKVALCSLHVTPTKCSVMPCADLGFHVCEGRAIVLPHLFQKLGYIYERILICPIYTLKCKIITNANINTMRFNLLLFLWLIWYGNRKLSIYIHIVDAKCHICLRTNISKHLFGKNWYAEHENASKILICVMADTGW